MSITGIINTMYSWYVSSLMKLFSLFKKQPAAVNNQPMNLGTDSVKVSVHIKPGQLQNKKAETIRDFIDSKRTLTKVVPNKNRSNKYDIWHKTDDKGDRFVLKPKHSDQSSDLSDDSDCEIYTVPRVKQVKRQEERRRSEHSGTLLRVDNGNTTSRRLSTTSLPEILNTKRSGKAWRKRVHSEPTMVSTKSSSKKTEKPQLKFGRVGLYTIVPYDSGTETDISSGSDVSSMASEGEFTKVYDSLNKEPLPIKPKPKKQKKTKKSKKAKRMRSHRN